MKKSKKYILYVILLVFTIVTLNATTNVLIYNSTLNIAIKDYELSKFLLPSIVVLFNFLISLIFATIISKIERKNIEENNKNSQSTNKKERIIFSIIYSLAFIIFNIIFYWMYIKNMNVVTNTISNISTYSLEIRPIYSVHPEFNILFSFLSCLVIIPAIIKINCIHPKVDKKRKVLKIIGNSLVSILGACLILFNIYFYIDIPEFQYAYNIYQTEQGNKYIEILGYSDYMKNFTQKIIMPNKILKKDVFYITGFEDAYISGNILWNDLKDIFKYSHLIYPNKNYVLLGTPKEWFIENNQIYNQNKTEMIINQTSEDYIYIPATVEKIGNLIGVPVIKKDIAVSKENKYFSSYDGNVYCCDLNISNANFLYTPELTRNDDSIWCFSPKDEGSIKLKDDISGIINIVSYIDLDVVISKTLTNDIFLKDSYKNIIVEESNPTYSAIDGNLYNKAGTELINFNVNNEKYKIPNSVQKFGLNALEDICELDILIELDENNEYFIYENNILYNMEKTKVIFTKINSKRNYNQDKYEYYTEAIDEGMEIDETFRKLCESNNYEIKYKSIVEENVGREMLEYPA